MVYPFERSRTAKTTANGTPYLELSIYAYDVEDRILVCVPDAIADGVARQLTIIAHGHGGSEQIINSAHSTLLRDTTLDAGHIVTSAMAFGDAWANDAALNRYKQVHDYVHDIWPVTDVFLQGGSMGALTMANIVSRDLIPNVRATALIDGAFNLANAYNSPSYKSAITSAYGIASDGSDYTTKTAGHDALLLDPSTFDGDRLFLSASPADTAIPKGLNADLFYENLLGHPAAMEYVTGSGPHTDPPNYFPELVYQFFHSTSTDWPPATPLPPGIGEVELYTVVSGLAVRLYPAG